jgi:hypothetical protein
MDDETKKAMDDISNQYRVCVASLRALIPDYAREMLKGTAQKAAMYATNVEPYHQGEAGIIPLEEVLEMMLVESWVNGAVCGITTTPDGEAN